MITYIVPSYNQGEFIAETITSVLQNMEAGDQLVIADGASTDSTPQVVQPFLSDARVTWFSERDRGFSDAVRKALSLAKNAIIGIMSSDDRYLPGIRNRVLECFRDDSVVLAYADYEVIDVSGTKIGERRHFHGSKRDLISLNVLLPQSSTFFRKSALEGMEILSIRHDYIADVVLFNQICFRGNYRFCSELWSQVRKQPGSRTGKRNPGVQYLDAMDTTFADLGVGLRRSGQGGGLVLRARYEASSGKRLRAALSLMRAAFTDFRVIGHWLSRRALAYIVFGPEHVSRIKRWRGTDGP